MKKFLLLFTFSIFCFTTTFSQISVKSFRILPTDQTARITNPVIDQNGEKCALIKVVTSETGFAWEGGMLGITKVVKKIGEFWVYVPHGAKKITIKHSQLGILRNYIYTEAIYKATVYEMVLTTAKVVTTVENIETPMQWFTITSNPDGADVYINNDLIGTTPFVKKMEIGKYNYRLEKYMYHNSIGVVTLTEEKKETLTIEMKPSFGYVKINTTPENGAKIEIDGKPINGVTPYTSDKLLSGKHTATLKKVMFTTKTIDFNINDGQTTELNIAMAPNFATITVQTIPGAGIYIDDVKQCTEKYTGRIIPGLHTFEAKKNKYKSDKQQFTFTAGENKTISLHPLAKTGIVDVVSTPFDAIIKIDGKNYGTTPNTIKNLLIGDYKLTITKSGYGTITKNITITENKTTTVNEILPSGAEVTINTKPSDVAIYIDGTLKGTTPFTSTLSFGNHKVKLINGKKNVKQTITVRQNGKNQYHFNVLESDYYKAKSISYRKVKNTSLIISAVSAGVGGYFVYSANKNYNEYQNALGNSTDLHKKIKTQDIIWETAFGVSAVSLITAIIFNNKAKKTKRNISADIIPIKDGIGVNLVYNF